MKYKQPRMKLSGAVRDYAIEIEQRMDFMIECTNDKDLVNSFAENSMKEFIEQLLTGFKP